VLPAPARHPRITAALAGLLLAVATSARAQVHESFDDQVDVPPFTRLDPVGLACACGPRATWSFVDLGGGAWAYRMQADASAIGSNALGPSRALSYAAGESLTDFYAAVDYLEWTAAGGTISSRHGLGAARDVGVGTSDGYALVHDYPVGGSPQAVALVRYDDEAPTTLATAAVALDPGKDHRLIVWRRGSALAGELRELPGLSLVASLAATDASGWTGLAPGLLVGGSSYDDLPNAVFDDFHAGPLAADSDGDGLGDLFEVRHGFDPLDADEDANGRPDGMDDADADGLGNGAEQGAGTNPVVADSDADGLLDGAEIGSGIFAPQQSISTSAIGAASVFAADVDGDGDADVLSASQNDDKIAWYENTDGQGAFGPQQVISTAAAGAISVFAADVDGDGDTDVLSASYIDDEVAWYENTDGQGTFAPQQVISTAAAGAYSVFAADVDGDGDTDVLSASYVDDEIAWYENTDGQETFAAQQVISTAADAAFSVFAADVDGDGDADVLSASVDDDEIAWYENSDGQGTFGAQQVISTAADGAWSVSAADVDGDGDADVLSASAYDDEIAWYENTDGQGSFGAQQPISAAADAAFDVSPADLDGDGDTDLLSASHGDDTIAWYENTDGEGTFGPQQVISTAAAGAMSVFAADVDGDGDADVLSASELDDRIAWYEQLEVADPLDPDSDDDGLLDGFEVAHGFDPLAAGEQGQDPDADGLTNLQEQGYATNPTLADTDADSWLDGVEVAAGSDPLDSGSTPPAPGVPAAGALGRALLALGLLLAGIRAGRRRGGRAARTSGGAG
jgi:hypothetical protein